MRNILWATDYTLPKPKVKCIKDVGKDENAQKFFDYWASIPPSKLDSVIVPLFRIWPLHDKKKVDPKARIEEITWTGKIPFDPKECYQFFLDTFGSGDWKIELQQAGVKGPIAMAFFGSHGPWDKYPPKVDPRTLIHGPFKNKDYISWLEKQPGLDLPWTKTPEQQEENKEVTVATVLADQLSKQAERHERQVEKLEEKIDEIVNGSEDDEEVDPEEVAAQVAAEAAAKTVKAAEEQVQSVSSKVLDTALGMISKQVDRVTTESAKSYNPIEVAKSVMDMAKAMNGEGQAGIIPLMTLMIEQQKEETKFWRERYLTLPQQQTAVASQPKSLIEQLSELAEAKSVIREISGRAERAPAEREEHTPRKNWLETLLENPVIIQTGLALLTQILQRPGATPAAAPDALRTALEQNTRTATPAPAPQPNSEDERRKQTLLFLKQIEKTFVTHFFDLEKQELSGYTFAHCMHCEFVPNGQPTERGRSEYLMVRDKWGLKIFDQVIRSYPPIWEMVQGTLPKYQEFLTQFFEYDKFIDEQQGHPEESPGPKAA